MACDILDYAIYASTAVGMSVVLTHVYCSCSVLFMDFKTWVDFIIQDIEL